MSQPYQIRRSAVKTELLPFPDPIPIPIPDHIALKSTHHLQSKQYNNSLNNKQVEYLQRRIKQLQNQIQDYAIESRNNQIYQQQFKRLSKELGQNQQDVHAIVQKLMKQIKKQKKVMNYSYQNSMSKYQIQRLSKISVVDNHQLIKQLTIKNYEQFENIMISIFQINSQLSAYTSHIRKVLYEALKGIFDKQKQLIRQNENIRLRMSTLQKDIQTKLVQKNDLVLLQKNQYINDLADQYQRTNDVCKKNQYRIEQLKIQLHSKTNQYQRQVKQNQQLLQEIKNLRSQNRQIRDQMYYMQTQKMTLMGERSMKEDYKAKISDLLSEIQQIKDRYHNENREIVRKYEQQMDMNERIKIEMDEISRESNNLQRQIWIYRQKIQNEEYQIKKLQGIVRSKDNIVEQLMQKLQKQQEQYYRDYGESKRKLQYKVNNYENQKYSLQKQLQNSKYQVQNLRNQIQSQKHNIVHLQNNIQQLRIQTKHLQRQINRLQQVQQAYMSLQFTQSKQRSKLSEQLQTSILNQRQLQLEQKTVQLQRQKQQYSQKCIIISQQLIQLQQKITIQITNKQTVTNKYNKLKQEYQHQLWIQKQKNNKISHELSISKEQNKRIQYQLKQRQSRVIKLQNTIQQLRSTKQQISNIKQQHNNNIKKLDEQHNNNIKQLNEQIQKMNKQKIIIQQNMNKQIEKYRQNIKQNSKVTMNLKDLNHKQQSQLAQLYNSKNRLESRLIEMQKQVEQKSNIDNQLLIKIETLSAQNKQINKNMVNMQQQYDNKLKTIINDRQNRIKIIEELKQENAHIKQQLDYITKQKQQYYNQFNRMRSLLKTSKQQNQYDNHKIEQLSAQITNLTHKINKLSQQYKQYKQYKQQKQQQQQYKQQYKYKISIKDTFIQTQPNQDNNIIQNRLKQEQYRNKQLIIKIQQLNRIISDKTQILQKSQIEYKNKHMKLMISLRNLQNQVINLKRTTKQHIRQKQNLQHIIQAMRAQNTSYIFKIKQLTNNKQQLQSKISQLTSKFNIISSQNSQPIVKVSGFQTLLQSKHTKHRQLQQGYQYKIRQLNQQKQYIPNNDVDHANVDHTNIDHINIDHANVDHTNVDHINIDHININKNTQKPSSLTVLIHQRQLMRQSQNYYDDNNIILEDNQHQIQNQQKSNKQQQQQRISPSDIYNSQQRSNQQSQQKQQKKQSQQKQQQQQQEQQKQQQQKQQQQQDKSKQEQLQKQQHAQQNEQDKQNQKILQQSLKSPSDQLSYSDKHNSISINDNHQQQPNQSSSNINQQTPKKQYNQHNQENNTLNRNLISQAKTVVSRQLSPKTPIIFNRLNNTNNYSKRVTHFNYLQTKKHQQYKGKDQLIKVNINYVQHQNRWGLIQTKQHQKSQSIKYNKYASRPIIRQQDMTITKTQQSLQKSKWIQKTQQQQKIYTHKYVNIDGLSSSNQSGISLQQKKQCIGVCPDC